MVWPLALGGLWTHCNRLQNTATGNVGSLHSLWGLLSWKEIWVMHFHGCYNLLAEEACEGFPGHTHGRKITSALPSIYCRTTRPIICKSLVIRKWQYHLSLWFIVSQRTLTHKIITGTMLRSVPLCINPKFSRSISGRLISSALASQGRLHRGGPLKEEQVLTAWQVVGPRYWGSCVLSRPKAHWTIAVAQWLCAETDRVFKVESLGVRHRS